MWIYRLVLCGYNGITSENTDSAFTSASSEPPANSEINGAVQQAQTVAGSVGQGLPSLSAHLRIMVLDGKD